MKSVVLLLGALFISLCADAQSALVVHQKTGEKVYYAMSEKPYFVYSDKGVTIKTKKASVEYSFSKIAKLTFDDMANGIDVVSVADANVNIGEESIVITGLSAKESVCVYGVNGSLVNAFKADANGTAILEASALPSGMLVVKSKNVSFKYLKK